MSEHDRHGRVIEETPAEAAEREARERPPAPTPLELERARRAEVAEAERQARWQAGVEREGLAPLMARVEQRLRELEAFLPGLWARRALLPRVVALARDALDLDLPRALRDKIHALDRRVQAEPAMTENGPCARRLLADIRATEEFEQLVGLQNPNLFREWRRQLSWYTAPIGDADVAGCVAELEALERAILALSAARAS
jgi:hypothetical protein